jgi:hypothetical protein
VQWTEGLLSIRSVKKEVFTIIGKKSILKKHNFWIVNEKILEIKFARIDGSNKFNHLLSCWDRFTLDFVIYI